MVVRGTSSVRGSITFTSAHRTRTDAGGAERGRERFDRAVRSAAVGSGSGMADWVGLVAGGGVI